MSKNVLITGAAGFLGSHLVLNHLSQGHRVLGIDNCSSSKINSRHLRLIHELYSPDNWKFFKADIINVMALNAAVEVFLGSKKNKIDLVYNFACPASPPVYQSMPVETLLTCTQGTANILNLAKKNNSIVVHASTSEVYGDPQISPQTETYRGYVNPYGPRSCYDEGKRAAEALCYDFLNTHDLDVRLVRIFNTYGPHMDPDDGRVISNFITQTLRGQPITIYGDGTQTRSFCYVDDTINAIIRMAKLENNPRTPINCGNPQEYKIIELVDIILKILNKEKSSINKVLPIDDPLQRKPDITLANQILGWNPKISLEEGIARTVDWFQGEIGFTN